MPRPRKPTALHVVDGTFRADRHGGPEPQPDPAIPPLPEGWESEAPWRPEAVREYNRLAPELLALGLVTSVDRAALMAVADAWGRWRYYAAEVGEGGAWQTARSGYESPRPCVAMMNRAQDDLRKALSLFGLSPADRSKVTARAERERDPADEFFAPKGL